MTATDAVLTAYFVVLLLLAGYGSHRYRLMWTVRRRAAAAAEAARAARDRGLAEFHRDPPAVLVQLPVFNERHVVERLIRAVAALDYPRDRLTVQVLDDSTDDTGAIAEKAVAEARAAGLAIERRHRADRVGFKAGALAAGLEAPGTAIGAGPAATPDADHPAKPAPLPTPFVAIFDADFVPEPDFLRETVPVLLGDPGLGMAQARWEHLNRSYSVLTEVQAILLDGHFIGEHGGRHAAGCFFNFNGTAGVWRREAILDAGGWEGDTLTEDLDLSYRAQLRGWRFVFLPEVAAPAELPVSMTAFKAQQRRWAKGAFETAKKLLPQILASPLPFRVRAEALFHLTGNAAYPLMALLSLLLIPALAARAATGLREMALLDFPIFLAATLSVISFYAFSQRRVRRLDPSGPGRWRRARHIPMALAVGIGLSFSNTAAVLEGALGRKTPFVRTPKFGLAGGARSRTDRGWRRSAYRTPEGAVVALELLVGAAMAAAAGWALLAGVAASTPFLLLFAVGYLYVGGRSLAESRALRRTPAGSSA